MLVPLSSGKFRSQELGHVHASLSLSLNNPRLDTGSSDLPSLPCVAVSQLREAWHPQAHS